MVQKKLNYLVYCLSVSYVVDCDVLFVEFFTFILTNRALCPVICVAVNNSVVRDLLDRRRSEEHQILQSYKESMKTFYFVFVFVFFFFCFFH